MEIRLEAETSRFSCCGATMTVCIMLLQSRKVHDSFRVDERNAESVCVCASLCGMWYGECTSGPVSDVLSLGGKIQKTENLTYGQTRLRSPDGSHTTAGVKASTQIVSLILRVHRDTSRIIWLIIFMSPNLSFFLLSSSIPLISKSLILLIRHCFYMIYPAIIVSILTS